MKAKVRCRNCKYEMTMEVEDPSATLRFGYCPNCLNKGTFRGGPLELIEVIDEKKDKTENGKS